ncbi:hypothetical protein SAMN05446635_4249 [Burkholderia sp. OK233]|nr:hypothetical protein SAMN05446635_4249 [Burkholderia sp. OK233]
MRISMHGGCRLNVIIVLIAFDPLFVICNVFFCADEASIPVNLIAAFSRRLS